MDEPIFNTVTGIFGGRGTGKTPFIKGEARYGIPGIMNLYPKKGMKVLIIDTIDHPKYRDISTITPGQIKKWGPSTDTGAARVWVSAQDMPKLNELINSYMWNALIVYEDAYKHQRKYLDGSILELIGDSKQKNVDLVFMYHCWIMAPKDLYRYLDAIEIFKTKDSPESRKDDMLGYYNEALEIHNRVMANPSRFYHESLNTEL